MSAGKLIAQSTRLELREFSPQDASAFYHLNKDPQVLQYTGDQPFKDPAAALSFIRQYQHYAQYGFGRWAIYFRATQCFIGFCGLKYSASSQEVDLGFRLARKYWRQGIATEAACMSLDVGFTEYQLTSIVGRAMQANLASHAVLKKLNFQPEKEFIEHLIPWIQYRMDKKNFLTVKL